MKSYSIAIVVAVAAAVVLTACEPPQPTTPTPITEQAAPRPPRKAPPSQPQSISVFRIHLILGDDQVRERIQVDIDGNTQVYTLNAAKPFHDVDVPLKPGTSPSLKIRTETEFASGEVIVGTGSWTLATGGSGSSVLGWLEGNPKPGTPAQLDLPTLDDAGWNKLRTETQERRRLADVEKERLKNCLQYYEQAMAAFKRWNDLQPRALSLIQAKAFADSPAQAERIRSDLAAVEREQEAAFQSHRDFMAQFTRCREQAR